jgi:hypothetical protein
MVALVPMLVGAGAMAAVIVQPMSVFSTAPPGEFPSIFPVENFLNQIGLSETYESGVTDFDAYVSTVSHSNDLLGIGSVGSGPPVDIDFDLGASLGVSGIALWNLHGGTNQLVEINLFASEQADFSTVTDLGVFDVSLRENVFLFPESYARYLRLRVTQNGGGAESSFFHLAARTPEPGTGLLLATGLGVLAGTRRRRGRSD